MGSDWIPERIIRAQIGPGFEGEVWGGLGGWVVDHALVQGDHFRELPDRGPNFSENPQQRS